jgi:serine/threonine protein kinase
MTTAISIEDVRREVKILKALSGHQNLVKFYDACEDGLNVYIVMEYVLFYLIPILTVQFLKLKFTCLLS